MNQTTTPNAGSAAGIDLAKMSRDEVIKIMIKRDMLSQHGYRTLLNGDFISLNLDHLTALANAALARATSQHPRPTDDELWDATLRDRDQYHEWADKLAGAIAIHFSVDIGEHSNMNLPWSEALDAIENAPPPGDNTLLASAYASFSAAVEKHIPRTADAATPQHPSAPAAAVRAAERIDAMHKDVVGVFAAIKAEHDAATPQHSVTEQAKTVINPRCGLCSGTGISTGHAGTLDPHPCPRCAGYGEFAQPLASTAATQPEQASIDWIYSVVRDVSELDRDSPEDEPDMLLVTADELFGIIRRHAPARAALAIPASTATKGEKA